MRNWTCLEPLPFLGCYPLFLWERVYCYKKESFCTGCQSLSDYHTSRGAGHRLEVLAHPIPSDWYAQTSDPIHLSASDWYNLLKAVTLSYTTSTRIRRIDRIQALRSDWPIKQILLPLLQIGDWCSDSIRWLTSFLQVRMLRRLVWHCYSPSAS